MTKDYKILLGISVVSFALVSLMITLLYFFTVSDTDGITTAGMICGAGFWIFLLLGILCQAAVSGKLRRQKKSRPPNDKKNKREEVKLHIGLISFCKNPYGMVSDLVFAAALVAFVISYLITDGTGIACYIALSLMIFSFCTHCIFNGKNYYLLSHKKRHSNVKEDLK